MSLPSIGGGKSGLRESAIEYTAQVISPIVNGEVKLKIGEDALNAASLFETVDIAYAEINELKLADYIVTVKSDNGDYVISRLGSWCQPFYDELCGAYNKAVLRSLFIKGDPIITAIGNYRYKDNGGIGSGAAAIHVYENNVTVLPPDLSARRIPLCFVSGMEKADYELTLVLDTGDSYTFAKLGYDTVPFQNAIETQIRFLREKTLTAVRDIDPALTSAQASKLAGLMPRGAAASIGRLAGIAPSFTAALENRIATTRVADSYAAFKELCGPAQIWVGFREVENRELRAGNRKPGGGEGFINAALPDANSDWASGDDKIADDPYSLWMIAPSPNGRFAAVEFAEADSATFVYRTNGDFDAFARQLNNALEAISFRREVIRLDDSELGKPENADYYMGAKRTASLRFVRSLFAGRIIHSSAEAWKNKLAGLWSEK